MTAAGRRPVISGNWKMHLNHFEALQLVQKLSYNLTIADFEAADVTVHPPFTDLRTVQTAIDSDKMKVQLGAQTCHFEVKGAFTGEISPAMLAKLHVQWVIVGHSERRQLFGETDELVQRKLHAVLDHGMKPIVCVGETLEEREQGATDAKVEGQVRYALSGCAAEVVAGLVFAYEPIWAIGTGRTATPDDAQSTCRLVRRVVAEVAGAEAAEVVRVQYGGSVKAANAADLLGQPDVDGLLVGGASLDADEFAAIVAAAPR
ncbi:MAG: triose-phosphate isomerase [Acidimicrobiales bacterium]